MAIEHGGQIALRLDASEERAVYVGELSTRDRCATVRFAVDRASGAVDGEVLAGEPPQWLVAAARAILRSVARRCETGAPLPRRVQRWREDPANRPAGRTKRRCESEGAGGDR